MSLLLSNASHPSENITRCPLRLVLIENTVYICVFIGGVQIIVIILDKTGTDKVTLCNLTLK